MFSMHLRIGDAIEVVAGGGVGVQSGRILVPAGMLQGVVGSRGTVHFAFDCSSATIPSPRTLLSAGFRKRPLFLSRVRLDTS